MSKEKTYLKWYNKVGYGSGDVAGNVVYALLTSFVMIYLTDTIGLNAGVIGVLIAVSKILEQQLSVFCSTLADSRALRQYSLILLSICFTLCI